MNKKFELLEKYAGLVTVRNHLMNLLETGRSLFAKGEQNKIASLIREMDKEILKVALAPEEQENAPLTVVKAVAAPLTTDNLPVAESLEEKPKKGVFRRTGQE